MQNLADRLVESLAHVEQMIQKHTDATGKGPPPFTIAISREAGSRGAEVARVLGAKLGWKVYDKELLQKIAEEKGLSPRDLEAVDERVQSFVEEFFANLRTEVPNIEWAYRHRLFKELLELSAKERSIIVGRGAAQILPAATTLRVRIVAPLADRIAYVQKNRGLNEAEARSWVDRTDRERDRFLRDCFRKDPADLTQYDLILNSGQFDDEQCAQIIMQALAMKEKAVRK
jgi:cytidylate kinase